VGVVVAPRATVMDWSAEWAVVAVAVAAALLILWWMARR